MSPRDTAIAIVVSPRDWAERLHRFVADHGGARVRARVIDAREALDDDYAVLVAEDLTSFLTPRIVQELRERGRRILGVYSPDEPWGRERLRDLGVDDTIASDSGPEEYVRRVEALAATMDLDDELSHLVDAADAAGHDPGAETPGGSPGITIAVGGPPGGPGVTEVAVTLAAALAPATATVLVDGNDVCPSVAQRLDLPLHPNLRTAVDAVEHRGAALADALVRLDGPAASELAVLPGLPEGRDWRQVRPDQLRAVIDELVGLYDAVVVDTGPLTEELSVYGGASRFGLTRALLERADVVVGVGSSGPVGIARLLRWVADVRALAPLTELRLVLNRAPSSRYKRGEIREEVERAVPVPLVFAPREAVVPEAAWEGRAVRRGEFADRIGRLADSLGTLRSTSTPIRGGRTS